MAASLGVRIGIMSMDIRKPAGTLRLRTGNLASGGTPFRNHCYKVIIFTLLPIEPKNKPFKVQNVSALKPA